MDDRMEALARRLAALEERLARLERFELATPPHPTTLQAPVRIVDAEGTTLVEITASGHDRSLRLHNAAGQAVATLGADGTQSGYLAIRNSAGVLVGYLDVEVAGARLLLQDHEEHGGVVLFGGESGAGEGGGINIAADGTTQVGLWAGQEHGQVTVYGTTGRVAAALPATDEA